MDSFLSDLLTSRQYLKILGDIDDELG